MSKKFKAQNIYQALVGNEDPVTYLTHLIEQAEAFNSKESNYDIIKEYLLSSENCGELFPFIKAVNDSDQEHVVMIVFKALCHILMRLASDLVAHNAAETTIVNEVLKHGMKTIISFMKSKSAPKSKVALHLLSSMVALGGHVSLQVVTKLDFNDISYIRLMERTNLSKEEDVKTAFLNFIVLVISVSSGHIIRQLVEVKSFLSKILYELKHDRASTIILVLSTFKQYIVESASIPKTCKMRLFNDRTLIPVMKLFKWKGPQRKILNKKRKLEELDNIVFEVSEEEAAEVKACALDFMKSICCSRKNGIVFYDASFGMSEKNNNVIITQILHKFLAPYGDPISSDFVLSVLKACPDQIKFYLPLLQNSFYPRLSAPWLKAAEFYTTLMDSIDSASLLLKSKMKKNVQNMLTLARCLSFIDILNPLLVKEAFTNGHNLLCFYLCKFLKSMLENVKKLLGISMNFNSQETIYNFEEISAFKKSFISIIFKSFQLKDEILMYWSKITVEPMDTPEDESVKDIPKPTVLEEISIILDLLKTILHISRSESYSMDFEAHLILSRIQDLQSRLSKEDMSQVCLNIIDLFLIKDNFAMWNEKNENSPLSLFIDVYKSAHKANDLTNITKLLRTMLLNTKMFDSCQWEIGVWIDAVNTARSKHIPLILEFIASAMSTLLKNPKKFSVNSERIVEDAIDEIYISDSLKLLKDFLNDDENVQDLPVNSESNHLPKLHERNFSSFVPAILYTQSLQVEFHTKVYQTFLEDVLTTLMHRLHSREELFAIILPYKSVLPLNSYVYLELLSSPKEEILLPVNIISNSESCCLNLIGHLKQNFLCNHSADKEIETCSCNVTDLLQNLDGKSVKQVIYQVLTYLDFEVSLGEAKKKNGTLIQNYLSLLEQFLNWMLISNLTIAQNETSSNTDIFEIKRAFVYEVVHHPVISKLFLNITQASSSCVSVCTRLVCDLTEKALLTEEGNFPFFLSNKEKMLHVLKQGIKLEGIDVVEVIKSFSRFLSSADICVVLESLFTAEVKNTKLSDFPFDTVFLLLNRLVEKGEFHLMSPSCFHDILTRFISTPKKLKKFLRQNLVEILRKRPELAMDLSEDISRLLLQHRTKKDLPFLGLLVDSCDTFSKTTQLYILECNEDENTTDFIFLASKCLNRSSGKENQSLMQAIALKFWSALSDLLLVDITSELEILEKCEAGKAATILFKEQCLSSKKLTKLVKLLGNSEINLPSSSKLHVFLQILDNTKSGFPNKEKYTLRILKIAFSWLQQSVFNHTNCKKMTEFISEFLMDFDEITLSEIVDLNVFFASILKVALKEEDIGKLVIPLLTMLCKKSKEGDMPTETVHSLVVGHSNFFKIMLMEIIVSGSLKECVIDLLAALTQRDSNVCKENHIGLFLSAYEGTLAVVDQKLLCLLKLYSDNNVNMVKYSPFLRGKAALAHYSILNNRTMFLWKQPKLLDVLNTFLPDIVESTVLNYPLEEGLQPCVIPMADESLAHKVYDHRFFLPLFANLLSPGAYVYCSTILESQAMRLIFASLSSSSEDVRAVAYYCLSQLYQHLEGVFFKEKKMWMSLLDSLRNSIEKKNARVSPIVTLFLGKTATIFAKGEHKLYGPLFRFIMAKPCLDIRQIPEFYRLFNSIDIEHRVHRLWLLDLLADGLRHTLDFHLCEKAYVFRTIFVHYLSCLSTYQEKSAILRIIHSAVKIQSSGRTLYQNGLLPWLLCAVEQSDPELNIQQSVEKIIDVLKRDLEIPPNELLLITNALRC